MHPSTEKPRPEPTGACPIFWKAPFPKDVSALLVSRKKPACQVTNSDLELAGRMLHHACTAQWYYIQGMTTLAQTYNTDGLWWQQKGYGTSTSPLTHLLCLQAMQH